MQKAVAKERYQLILIGPVILFFSAAILAAARLFGWIPPLFTFCLGIVCMINLSHQNHSEANLQK